MKHAPLSLRQTDLMPAGPRGASLTALLARLKSPLALRLVADRANPKLATGVAPLDALLGGGLPRAAICELLGSGTSGRTALIMAILAAATQRGETVAWVDPLDALDPRSVEGAGVVLDRFLWVRPAGRNLWPQALKAVELILDAGGFAVVVLDIADSRGQSKLGGPTCWIRLHRRLETSNSVLLISALQEVVGSTASLRLGCCRLDRTGKAQIQVLRRRGSAPTGSWLFGLAEPLD